MRILFLTGEFPPLQGGVGDCTNEIAKALTALKVETHVLTTAVSSQRPTGVPVGRSVVSVENNLNVQRSVLKWDWRAWGIIRRVARETNADIIHTQYQTAAFGMHPAINFAPSILGKGLGVRFVITYHDLRPPFLFPKAGRVREWVTFFPARVSDAAIATSEQDRLQLAYATRKQIELIPIGSNIAPAPPPGYDRHAWRKKYGVSENDLLLCYFGFLNDSKGGMDLMRALALIPNAKLVMVGGQVGASDATNRAYLARVKNLSAELGLDTRVIWTDYTAASEVSANLLAADVCVLPYRDGVSFRRGSFMAALAHGLAIVTTKDRRQTTDNSTQTTTRDAAMPQLQDGKNVVMVPPENPRGLAEAIMRLANDSALRAKISAGARQLAENFTWDKIAARHLELYERLLASSKG